MAECLTVNGNVLVYGLAWVSITHAGKEKSELSGLIREAQAQYFVRCAAREVKYGLVRRSREWTEDRIGHGMLSAAVLFAHRTALHADTENSLLIQRINDNQIAVIALLKGVPYLDMVAGNDELNAQLKSLYQEGHADGFVAYGNVLELVTHVLNPEDLTTGNCGEAILRCFTDPVRRLQRLGGIAAGIALIASLAVWEWNQKMQQRAVAKKAADPALVYEERIQKILSTANFSADAALKTIWPVLQKREVEMAGWSLKSVRCNPTRCEELWQQSNGSYAALRQKIPASETIRLQPNNVTSLVQIPLTGKGSPLPRTLLPNKESFWNDLVSQQQQLKRIHPLLVFTPKKPEMRGLSSELAAESIPAGLAVYGGDIAVSAPLGLAFEIFQKHLAHIMISEVAVEGLADVHNAKLLIKGNYYAKNE